MYNPIAHLHVVINRKGMHQFIRKNAMALSKDMHVLNIGSGGAYGRELEEAAQKIGFKITSFDISEDRNPDIVGDITTHDFGDVKFDAIVMLDVIEHIPNAFEVPAKLHAILKENGKLILSAPFLFPIHDKPHDYYRFTHYALRYMFSMFEDLEIEARNNWAESLNALRARICVERWLPLKLWGHMLMIFCLLAYPFIYLIGKLLPTDTMTTGYILTGVKR